VWWPRFVVVPQDVATVALEVVELPAPTVTEADGEIVDYSYVNHYLCNGGVVLCGFNDPMDEHNAGIFRRLFPERTVTLVDARTIFAAGGGIHCTTQQQPAVDPGAAGQKGRGRQDEPE